MMVTKKTNAVLFDLIHLGIVIECNSQSQLNSSLVLALLDARQITLTQNPPTSQRFTTRQHKSRQNSERHYTLLPPPNAHLPQVSPLHYSISLALLASLQPLSRLIISSSNGRGRQQCRLRPRHITAAQICCARALFFAQNKTKHKKHVHAPAPCYSSYAESLRFSESQDCVSKNGKSLRDTFACASDHLKHDPLSRPFWTSP